MYDVADAWCLVKYDTGIYTFTSMSLQRKESYTCSHGIQDQD
jgi:hypothetical protein